MILFLVLAQMLEATELVWGEENDKLLALAHMLNDTQLVWGGGMIIFFYVHTCWMLRSWSGLGGGMITLLALAHMLAATQLVWGGMTTFLAFAHMLDATQLVLGWGGMRTYRISSEQPDESTIRSGSTCKVGNGVTVHIHLRP